jgi:hypothetical protein
MNPARTRPGQKAREPGQYSPVGVGEPGPARTSLDHRDLVTQRDQFGLEHTTRLRPHEPTTREPRQTTGRRTERATARHQWTMEAAQPRILRTARLRSHATTQIRAPFEYSAPTTSSTTTTGTPTGTTPSPPTPTRNLADNPTAGPQWTHQRIPPRRPTGSATRTPHRSLRTLRRTPTPIAPHGLGPARAPERVSGTYRPQKVEQRSQTEGVGTQEVEPTCSFPALGDQAGTMQHPNVLARRLLGDGEVRGDLAGGELLAGALTTFRLDGVNR